MPPKAASKKTKGPSKATKQDDIEAKNRLKESRLKATQLENSIAEEETLIKEFDSEQENITTNLAILSDRQKELRNELHNLKVHILTTSQTYQQELYLKASQQRAHRIATLEATARVYNESQDGLNFQVASANEEMMILQNDTENLQSGERRARVASHNLKMQGNLRQDEIITALRNDFDKMAKLRHQKYKQRNQLARDEVKAKRVQIEMLESLKDRQIALIETKQAKNFCELKEYFDNIIKNCFEKIKKLKETHRELQAQFNKQQKTMADVTSRNRALSEPLRITIEEVMGLKKRKALHDSDKQTLQQLSSEFQVQSEILEQHKLKYEIALQRYSITSTAQSKAKKELQTLTMEIYKKRNLLTLIGANQPNNTNTTRDTDSSNTRLRSYIRQVNETSRELQMRYDEVLARRQFYRTEK